jgi:hypothetical protein
MKLEALDHPKTLELATQLDVELPAAIGYLELFWAFVAKRTPCGDVGKWSDGVIAQGCLWRGKPSQFVQGLIAAGFVDPDTEHRLLVHDWPQHCPNWVRAKLKTAGLAFILKMPLKSALKTPPNGPSNVIPIDPSIGASSRADLNQAKPSEAKSSEALPARANSEIFDGWKFITDRMRPNYPEGEYPETAWMPAARTAERIVETDGLEVLDAIEAGCRRFQAKAEADGDVGSQFIVNPDRWLTERRWTGKFSPKGKRSMSSADRVTWKPDPEEEAQAQARLR